MKKVEVVLVIIAILLVTIACGTTEATPEKVGTGQAGSKTATPTAKPEVFAIGNVVKAGDIQVTINKAFDIQPTEFYSPEVGNRFIGIDATFENVGDGTELIDTDDFKLIGPDGYQYATSFEAEVAGDLKIVVENLLPGMKINGSAGFEIPADQTGFRLIYKPSFTWEDIVIEFDIGY